MNLEDIERKCLTYLEQSQNPIVPLDALLRFLRRSEEHSALSEKDLLDFLRPHELFHVVEPMSLDDDTQRELAEAGLAMRPSVMLFSRVPTSQQVKESMLANVDQLTQALEMALDEARAARDRDKARRVRETIKRAKMLRQRIDSAL